MLAESAPATIAFAGLDRLFGYRLRRAQGAVHRDYLATLAELKLTQKQTAVMWLVMANPGVAQGAIGGVLGMDRATIMALVNRLEARGLLQRRHSTVDARRRELHATAAGLRLMEQVRAYQSARRSDETDVQHCGVAYPRAPVEALAGSGDAVMCSRKAAGYP